MVYGYVRVSTGKQEYTLQTESIRAFALGKGFVIGDEPNGITFVEETRSGKVSWKDRKLASVIDNLQSKDILIVTELSRLGRSMLEVMELLSVLSKKEVMVYAIKGGYELGDNIQSKVLAFAFSLAAEIERELISQRTKEALSVKKATGTLREGKRGPDRQPRKRRGQKEE
jgi:putative DNA-invertase from lambdoid prophage Rac